MAYSPIAKASDFFTPTLYVGNGSTKTVTGIPFEPDMTWIKNRVGATDNEIYDKVRGVGYRIYTNTSAGQDNLGSQGLSAWTSDGFTVGNNGALNGNGNNQVSWNWKANGSGSANTDGSINSTVSVNTTSGFSIVNYTGNGTSGAYVGHGLGVVPGTVLVKRLDASDYWIMYNRNLNTSPGNYYIRLNDNGAPAAFTGMWNDTAPTSSSFYLGNSASTNASGGNYIAYCFSEVQGYSVTGRYRGNANASDGTFVNCGFRPSMVIQKRLDGADNWFIFDEKRDGYNGDNEYLFPNLTQAESSGVNRVDLFSNGFKLTTADGGNNANGGPYLYMAFGQTLVGSNNMPANAR